jgi:NAD-dependent dihydropyrimidine dehydrogenase PreA subunit
MAPFTIDTETCSREGICAAVRPVGIIDFQKGALPKPRR